MHAVSGLLLVRGCNIEEAQQFNDQGTGLFFMRVQFVCQDAAALVDGTDLAGALADLAGRFDMQHALHAAGEPDRKSVV